MRKRSLMSICEHPWINPTSQPACIFASLDHCLPCSSIYSTVVKNSVRKGYKNTDQTVRMWGRFCHSLPTYAIRAFFLLFRYILIAETIVPRHDKMCLGRMRTANDQIRLRMRAIWSGPSFSTLVKYKNVLYSITKTRLYDFDPLKPHFYIVKLGFTGVYIVFPILLKT